MSTTKTVLLTGVKGAGKKSILENMFNEVNCRKIRDNDFEIRECKYKNLRILSFDIDYKDIPSGVFKVRYFDGLIFVIDSKDRVKLGNINIYILFSGWIRQEISQYLNNVTGKMVPDDVINMCYEYFNPDLCPLIGTYYTGFDILESLEVGEEVCSSRIKYDAPVLIFGNKSDLCHGMDKSEITKKLNMKSFERKWFVHMCSAKNGDGLQFGLNWMHQTLNLK